MLKTLTNDEAFKEQCFLWERGTSVGEDLFNFQDLLRAQTFLPHMDRTQIF